MLLNSSAVMMMIQVFLCKIIPAVRVIAPKREGVQVDHYAKSQMALLSTTM